MNARIRSPWVCLFATAFAVISRAGAAQTCDSSQQCNPELVSIGEVTSSSFTATMAQWGVTPAKLELRQGGSEQRHFQDGGLLGTATPTPGAHAIAVPAEGLRAGAAYLQLHVVAVFDGAPAQYTWSRVFGARTAAAPPPAVSTTPTDIHVGAEGPRELHLWWTNGTYQYPEVGIRRFRWMDGAAGTPGAWAQDWFGTSFWDFYPGNILVDHNVLPFHRYYYEITCIVADAFRTVKSPEIRMPGGIPEVPKDVVVARDAAGMRVSWKNDDPSTTMFTVELAEPLPPGRTLPLPLTTWGQLGKDARTFVHHVSYQPSNLYVVCALDTDSTSADPHRASCATPAKLDLHEWGPRPVVAAASGKMASNHLAAAPGDKRFAPLAPGVAEAFIPDPTDLIPIQATARVVNVRDVAIRWNSGDETLVRYEIERRGPVSLGGPVGAFVVIASANVNDPSGSHTSTYIDSGMAGPGSDAAYRVCSVAKTHLRICYAPIGVNGRQALVEASPTSNP